MTSLSIALDRESLSLDPLLIPDWPSGATSLWVELVDNPDFVYRYTYAPDSAYVPGKRLMAAVLDQATLPLTIHGQGADSAALAALRAELVAALGQFNYTVTLTLDGADTSWSADCSTPAFGALDYGQQSALMFTATLTIPVNPPGVS